MRDLPKGMHIPDIGQMRELVWVCDGGVEPSQDDTLELVQRRETLWNGRAQVILTRPMAINDYRKDEDPDTREKNEFIVIFRAVPGLRLTTRDYIFWAERRPHFEADHWLRIAGIGDSIDRHRFTFLECCLHSFNEPTDREMPKHEPLLEQKPPY